MKMISPKKTGIGCGLLLVMFIWLGCTGESADAPPTLPPSELADLVAERLIIGREVAWAKYQQGLPILDAEREKAVLDRMEQRARELDLDPALVRRFFSAQITASRQLQEECIEGWENAPLLPEQAPLDLQRQIRPLLDDLGESILRNLDADSLATLSSRQAHQFLQELGFSKKVVSLALEY